MASNITTYGQLRERLLDLLEEAAADKLNSVQVRGISTCAHQINRSIENEVRLLDKIGQMGNGEMLGKTDITSKGAGARAEAEKAKAGMSDTKATSAPSVNVTVNANASADKKAPAKKAKK